MTSRFEWGRGSFRSHRTSKNFVNPLFWKELNQLPLMTKEEEYEYGRKIQAAVRRILELAPEALLPRRMFANNCIKRIISSLTKEEHKMFFEMVNRNLRMAVRVARSFEYKGVEFQDLVAAGIEGLVEAVLRYDPDHIDDEGQTGTRFSTYATWWIRHYIKGVGCEFGRAVRLPVGWHEEKSRASRARAKLELKFGREIRNSELAAAIGFSPDRLDCILSGTTSEISLNDIVRENEYNSPGGLFERIDFLTYDEGMTPEKAIEARMDAEVVNTALEELLSPIERAVLELRSREDLTLAECGKHPLVRALNGDGRVITREGIRYIQNRALQKLRFALQTQYEEHTLEDKEGEYFH